MTSPQNPDGESEAAGLQVPAVPWTQIEAWPIATAGLPTRIVSRALQRGYQTVGELRRIPEEEILQWRSVGTISIQKLHNFFHLCEVISRGALRLGTIGEIFMLFLDEDEANVLTARYNLRVPYRPHGRRTTLQEIGRMTNRTRERVRQVEESAFHKLHSNLARTCLEPFYVYFRSILTGMQGSAECRDIMETVDPSLFGDFNPCAVLAFFCELQPEIFTNRGSVFSLLSHSILSGIEQRLIQLLRSHQGPLPEPLLTRRFQESIPAPSASEIRVAPLIARDSDRILTTIDGRHLLPEHLSYVVAERMQQMTLPAHFRDIARAVNDLLTPASRVGAGIVLRQLNSSSLFSRVDRGLYTLAPRTGYAII